MAMSPLAFAYAICDGREEMGIGGGVVDVCGVFCWDGFGGGGGGGGGGGLLV